ncbi:hypothetical protein ACQR1I_35990 [Bradyrhizobium sp. HKCCYLS2038]|uniref:hypothetical protein n=1 Tax=Bradyrhizobium sp. HKCCYLS2038 TaxID=3420764 RepID=UPI003EB6C684
MSATARIAREDAITDALRVANDAIGDEQPTAQALRIIAAIKLLRSAEPVKVAALSRVNYLAQLQHEARREWQIKREILSNPGEHCIGPTYDATAGIDTPIGRFRCTTWRRRWSTGRIAWASEYALNDEPITIAEIEAAGLAQRPTTRARRKRGAI